MNKEAHPRIGTVLFDPAGAPCLVIKTWPWEDRASVLTHGHVELIPLDKFIEMSDDCILIASEEKDGKNRSASSSSEESSGGSTQSETA